MVMYRLTPIRENIMRFSKFYGIDSQKNQQIKSKLVI